MTFRELQDAALGTSFNETKYRSYAQRFINHAQQRIARRIGMATAEAIATVTTATGLDTYDVPADFLMLRGEEPIVDQDGHVLEQVEIGDMLTVPVAAGPPRYFAYTGNQIRLYPVPEGEQPLTMVYRANAPLLVNDDDEPVIPADYHELLVLYAKGRLWQEEDDNQAAATPLAMFEAELRAMRSELQRATVFRRQVPRMWNTPVAPTFRRP